MSLRIYNTLSREKELFEPVTPGKVGIYLCGPTVYKPSHIGHAVGPVVFDTVKRYLVHKGFEVRLIINITDVEDKLIEEAAAQGRAMSEIAREVEADYLRCLEALGVRSVDAFPRATENMDKIIALVERLVEKGAAYVVDGDVYFDHSAAVDYGKLSGRAVDMAVTGTRELAGRSRHPADFALWKASKPGEPAWDSPWGPGRPGWHIECSAMSMAMLGETFDIHGGGLDLVFPHHENEIAQSETATGKPFAKYWMHNGLTRVQTRAGRGQWRREKMSKSLGNIRPISELLEQYSGQTIRAFVLSTHYRRPLEFSDEQLVNTAKWLEGFHRLFERIARLTGQDPYAGGEPLEKVHALAEDTGDARFVRTVLRHRLRFYECMDDDFNTAGAIAALHEMAGSINRYIDQTRLESAGAEVPTRLTAAAGVTLVNTGRIIGLFESPPQRTQADLASVEPVVAELLDEAASLGYAGDAPEGHEARENLERLLRCRNDARKRKDFAFADKVRRRLAEKGITLEDTPSGTVWRANTAAPGGNR